MSCDQVPKVNSPTSSSEGIQAVGTSAKAADRTRATRRYRVQDLGVMQGVHRNISAINNAGHLAATLLDETTMAVRARVVANGCERNLGTLGGSFSAARGLNNKGQVVGGSLTHEDEEFHAFLFSDGVMYDLNDLMDVDSQWTLIEAAGINDKGQIIGIGSLGGEDHSFLLTPEAQADGDILQVAADREEKK